MDKPTIVYTKQEIGGILVRPDSRHVVSKGIAGHPIEVLNAHDYINLYHVFHRMKVGKKRLTNYEVFRRQVGRSKWVVYFTNDKGSVENPELEANYDPKRGRYKRYAEQLAAGEILVLPTRSEAVKARRAWHLYFLKAERRRAKLASRVERVRGGFSVRVVKKAR